MRLLVRIFPLIHLVISLMFVIAALVLVFFAMLQIWSGIAPAVEMEIQERLNAVLEGIALLTVSVAALELGQTLLEEEVQREAQMSAPTRVRRFLSRFMVVLVVALAIESLVMVFEYSHEEPANLLYAGVIGLMAAVLLAAWGVFVHLNRSVEELEPEAMAEVKEEDQKLQ
jgi:uncharacterized membrane protein